MLIEHLFILLTSFSDEFRIQTSTPRNQYSRLVVKALLSPPAAAAVPLLLSMSQTKTLEKETHSENMPVDIYTYSLSHPQLVPSKTSKIEEGEGKGQIHSHSLPTTRYILLKHLNAIGQSLSFTLLRGLTILY